MHTHVHVHTSKKFPCMTCNSQLSSRAALRKHTLLHLSTVEQKYTHCGGTYASKLALKVHMRGKHGAGYPCPKCGQVFNAPIKKAHHLKKYKSSTAPSASGESNPQDLSQADCKASPEGATDQSPLWVFVLKAYVGLFMITPRGCFCSLDRSSGALVCLCMSVSYWFMGCLLCLEVKYHFCFSFFSDRICWELSCW